VIIMSQDKGSNRFRDYLNKISDIEDDRCWYCKKSPEDIKQEYYDYMKNPAEEFEEFNIDDISIMSYKLKKPICAGCYFTMKKNPKLIKEVLEKPEDEVW